MRQLILLALMFTATALAAADFKPYTLQKHVPNFKAAKANGLEKKKLTFGFIKLTDCAALVIAKENGYFADEGLAVNVEFQANWRVLLDRVVNGELDGAHMLAGQPIAASVGVGANAEVITAFSMDLNGNGITVSNALWQEMQAADPTLKEAGHPHPITADSLKPAVEARKSSGAPMRMGMVFPVSTHNYEIRYWLAAAGISPGYYTADNPAGQADADVMLSVTPPPQMPDTLAAGTIEGYCVGEPWNQQAVFKGIGVPVTTNYDIWQNNPEKVFGVTKSWAETNPNTHLAVIKALIRAGQWLDAAPENRVKAVEMLSNKAYVGADAKVIANSMTGTFEFQKGDKRAMPDFNVFYRYHATYPFYTHCVWFLTQMRRWGQLPESKPDSWYVDQAKDIYRPDIYRAAFAKLLEEGKVEAADLPDASKDLHVVEGSRFIDGITFDPAQANAYLQSFAVGLK
ncbi:MAG: CmpA/NrtA family ABC transporter substrate-binding protein [Planctomycetota bacterium]